MKNVYDGFLPNDAAGVDANGVLGPHGLCLEILDLDNNVKQLAGRTLSAFSSTGLKWADRHIKALRANPITDMLVFFRNQITLGIIAAGKEPPVTTDVRLVQKLFHYCLSTDNCIFWGFGYRITVFAEDDSVLHVWQRVA